MTTPPPPRIYVPNGVQLTVRLQQAGQDAACVLGVLSEPGTGADAGLGQAWLNHFWARFRGGLVANVSCTGGTVRDVSQPDGVSFDLAAPPSPAGGQVVAGTVAAASFLIRWRTAGGGRSARGRTFLPGVAASQVESDGRTMQPATATAMGTSAQAYVDTFQSAVSVLYVPAVLSLTKGIGNEIISGQCAPIIGIQRRRMRG